MEPEFQGFAKPTILQHQPFKCDDFEVTYYESTKTSYRPLCRKNTIEASTDPLLNSPFPFTPLKREKTEDDIASEISDALSSHFSSTSSLTLEPQEKQVIVHRIRNTETLAGISLLYGVNPGELKRINKLWSDNLHLRQTLYIPLEMVNYQEVYLRLKSIENKECNQGSDWTDVSLTASTKSLIEIIKVPETELKYFSASQSDPEERNAPPVEFTQEDLPSLKEIFGVNKLLKFANKLKHHKKSNSNPTKSKVNLELQEH
ncbi:hypothetical protein K7432_000372 [Basidiobolus ranarum]|uniref:LysM domain-containing protein n=1 Tax=Basidiobolus ranarum TaxID=34480 RepID=A0ABR2WB99_9FUNG